MEEKILREILSVTRENNQILRDMNFQRRWTFLFWIIKWIVVAAIAYSAYIAATPYIEQAQNTYNQAQDTLNSINNLNQQAKTLQQNEKSFTDFLKDQVQKRIGQ
jgi:predicted PurR-regulated permease PerM